MVPLLFFPSSTALNETIVEPLQRDGIFTSLIQCNETLGDKRKSSQKNRSMAAEYSLRVRQNDFKDEIPLIGWQTIEIQS